MDLINETSSKSTTTSEACLSVSSVIERKSHSLLSLLVESGKNDDAASKLTSRDMLADTFIFMLAGHETSASALSSTFALLALHPHEQEAIYDELKTVLGSTSVEDLPYSDLNKLIYCNAVIKEALRLFPPAIGVPKIAKEDTQITIGDGKTYVIPEGTTVNLNIYPMHHNPACFPDPDEFKPSRWLSGGGADDAAFAAFSLGARSCIGKRFAQIEMVTVLAMVARRFTVSAPPGVTKEQLLQFENLITLHPKSTARLVFTERL